MKKSAAVPFVPSAAPGYSVSPTGLVMFMGERRRPHPGYAERGYMRVRGLDGRQWKIHRLVLIAFGPPMPSVDSTCHHKDRNRKNNHISNLEWASRSANLSMPRKGAVCVYKNRSGYTLRAAPPAASTGAKPINVAIPTFEFGLSLYRYVHRCRFGMFPEEAEIGVSTESDWVFDVKMWMELRALLQAVARGSRAAARASARASRISKEAA